MRVALHGLHRSTEFRRRLIVAAVLASRLAAAGGAKPPESAPAPVLMSPFEVRGAPDDGYRVAAAVTGTGTAGLIKDTPLNISIVAHELIDDQAGNQLIDVLRTASAVALHVKDESQILIRGYTGPQFVNGLPAGVGLSLYDVDRIEVVKGPNAVFAGISNPGGTVNLLPAKPSFRPRHSLEFAAGSFAHQRVVLTTSAPLVPDRLAYRFVFGRTDEKSAIDYMFTRERFVSASLAWKPLDRLTFTTRYGMLDREAGRRPHAVVSHPLFQARDREALQLFDRLGLPRPAAYPQLEDGAVRDAAGRPVLTGRAAPEGVDAFIARTLGPNVAPYPGIFARDFFDRDSANYNGPDGRDNYRNHTTSLEGEWLGSRELAVRGIFQQVDSNRLRREFNGLRPVAGQRLRSSISDFKPGGLTFSARLEGVFKFDLHAAGRHDLLAGIQHDGGKDVISPQTIATTRVVTYNPRTDPVLHLLSLLRDQYGPAYEEPGVVRKGGGHSNALYGVLQSSFFHDRLRTLIGARGIANHRPIDDNRDGIDEDFTTRRILPTVGLLARANAALSFYGSVSRTFVPQRQQTADLDAIRATQGDPILPTYRPPAVVPVKFLSADLTGRGWEAGAKLDLGERLFGTLSYFSNEEASRLDVDTNNQVLYQLPGATVRVAAGETRTRGLETEWVWTPRDYQALLSASYFFRKNEVSNPADPHEIGSALESVPRYTVTFWNRYSFGVRLFRGTYVGGGFTALGETYEHPSWTVPIKSAPVILVGAVAGHAVKFAGRPLEFRLNVRNLTNRRYLNGTFQYGEPRSAIGSVTLRY